LAWKKESPCEPRPAPAGGAAASSSLLAPARPARYRGKVIAMGFRISLTLPGDDRAFAMGGRTGMAERKNLTGVWHGLYSYERFREPVYFVATLIDGGSFVGGTTHESEIGERGAPLTLFASVEGTAAGQEVVFTKTYDGSGGWGHSVAYVGRLSADGMEIEGRWTIGRLAAGRFLMIRNAGVSESVVREAFEKV
jgi:hypothetical protein